MLQQAKNGDYALMPRDIDVLRDLARMRYLKTSQVERLNFPSRRVANRRLQVLYGENYVDRFRVPMLVGQGSNEFVYCLKEPGAELLTELQAAEPTDRHQPQRNGRPKNFFLMAHHLAINDFWIALERDCPAAGVEIAQFTPEFYGQRTENGGLRRLITDSAPNPEKPGEKLWFTPDAMFILERAGKRALFFLEIDRGTEKITSSQYAAFTDKVRVYQSYFRSGGFRRWGEHFKGFRVLVVTPSATRLANLLSAAKTMTFGNLFWFTDGVPATRVFAPVWRIQGEESPQAIIR